MRLLPNVASPRLDDKVQQRTALHPVSESEVPPLALVTVKTMLPHDLTKLPARIQLLRRRTRGSTMGHDIEAIEARSHVNRVVRRAFGCACRAWAVRDSRLEACL